MMSRSLLATIAASSAMVAGQIALAASITWTGAVGVIPSGPGAGSYNWNAGWTPTSAPGPFNWTPNVPSKSTTDTAVFDSSVSSGGSIWWTSTSGYTPKNTNFSFLAGAPSYTFAGATAVNNASNGISITTASGVTTNQTFSSVNIANTVVTMNGSGNLTLNQFSGQNSWDDTNLNIAPLAVNDANAVLTIGNFLQNRGYTTTKSGPGKLVLTGIVDSAYGFRDTNGTYISSTINVTGGTLDVSAATLNLESHLNGVEALVAGQKYTVVSYNSATLIGTGTTGFASITGALPSGWGIVNDTTDHRIYLQEVPEPSMIGAVLGLAFFAGLCRRSRRGA